MSLRQVDDEMQLVNLLQEFCRLKQKNADVFFDGAPPGMEKKRRFGRVTAHFTPAHTTADAAIQRFLQGMGRNARNVILVSSDHMVQAEARRSGAQVIPSEQFAAQLSETRAVQSENNQDVRLSEDEIENWLNLFKQRGNDQ